MLLRILVPQTCKLSALAEVAHFSLATARFLEDAAETFCLQGNKCSPQELPLPPILAVILVTRVKSQHNSTGNMLSFISMDRNCILKKFHELAGMYQQGQMHYH